MKIRVIRRNPLFFRCSSSSSLACQCESTACPMRFQKKKRSIACLTANIPADATLIMGASHFEVNEQDRRKVHEKRTPCLFLASAVKISYGFFPSASTSTGRVLSLPSVAGCLEGEEMWVWCHQLQGTTSSYRQS